MSSLPRIVFLFSDTGGGHRSAAQAIIEAFELEYPGQASIEMVDFFKAYAPALLARVPDIYPPLSRKPRLLGWIFHVSDSRRFVRVFLACLWPFIHENARRLLRDHPAELYVSVHPLINAPLGKAMDRFGVDTPFATVVTDLVSTHISWYWPRSNLVIVPSDAALRHAARAGLAPERLRVVGLPVAERCNRPFAGQEEIRARFGWPQDRPLALLVGGGEGMGPLEPTAQAIDAAGLPLALVIVAGRNQALKERLSAYPWRNPTLVYGFVQEMPDFMHAADILVTKAGPGTISEALSAGLPMILYSRLDGPEEGNVSYVVDHGVGIWAPTPEKVTAALKNWLEHPEARERAARNCLSVATPGAAHEIARLLEHLLASPDLERKPFP